MFPGFPWHILQYHILCQWLPISQHLSTSFNWLVVGTSRLHNPSGPAAEHLSLPSNAAASSRRCCHTFAWDSERTSPSRNTSPWNIGKHHKDP
jgi:hypothetical protein